MSICYRKAIFGGVLGLLLAMPSLGQLVPCIGTGPAAYVPLGSSNQVAVFNLVTDTLIGVCGNVVLAPARQGSGPVAVAALPFGVVSYATNMDSAASSTDPFTVVSPLLGGKIPIGTGQHAVAFNPVNMGMLYVTNAGADVSEPFGGNPTTIPGYAITVIDTAFVLPNAPVAEYAVVGTIPTDVDPIGLAITSDGASAYVSHSGSNKVLHLALPGGGVIASIDIGNRTDGIAVTPFSAAGLGVVPSAYVTIPTADAVAVISLATDTITGMIPVGRDPVAIAMNAAGTFAFVANNADGTISVINTAMGAVIATVPLSVTPTSANNPIGIGVDSVDGKIVILNAGTKTVSILSTATLAILANIPVPLNCKDSLTAGCPTPLIRSSVSEAGAPGADLTPMAASVGQGGGGGIAIGRTGDGGAEPLLYYSKLDGSTGAFGLYTGAAKPSLPASYLKMPPIDAVEREIAYDPFNKLLWYSAYDGKADHIFAVDPVTGAQANVDLTAFPGLPAMWDRHMFVDYGGKRLFTPNTDGSVSMYDLTTHALYGVIPPNFFRGTNPGYLRHFASDARTGYAWYAASDGSFVEIKTVPSIVETGRVIPFASQMGGPQNFRRHFVIDPKRNQLIYEVNAGGNYALASIRLDTLKTAEYVMTPNVFSFASQEPYLTITLVNAEQCRLTLSAQPSTGGSIVVSPEGNPGGYFDCGSTVTLNALANPGSQFGGFSADLKGSLTPQTLFMNSDHTVSASFSPGPPVAVTVSPTAPVTLTAGQTKQYTASVSNTWNRSVSWSLVSGPGTLDANGFYTAPNPIVAGTTVVRATSTADPHQSATATIQGGVNVTLQTSPANLLVSLDGGAFVAAPLTVALAIGSTHTIASESPQSAANGTPFMWQSWSDGLAIAHGITVPATDTVITATFTGGPAAPVITGVVNDAGFVAGTISTGSWVAIFGNYLATPGDSRTWNADTEIVNGVLPASLDGVSVTVNGKPAAVEFISPTQVNIQPPDDATTGPVQVVVKTSVGASNAFTVNYAPFAPGLFSGAGPYIVAQHADGSYVTAASPAKPGEVIVLWGSGFGSASPPVPAGQVFSGANPLANTVTVTIGGESSAVSFAGVVLAGLVQINVQVPADLADGDAAVVAAVGGVTTQTTGHLPVHN